MPRGRDGRENGDDDASDARPAMRRKRKLQLWKVYRCVQCTFEVLPLMSIDFVGHRNKGIDIICNDRSMLGLKSDTYMHKRSQ